MSLVTGLPHQYFEGFVLVRKRHQFLRQAKDLRARTDYLARNVTPRSHWQFQGEAAIEANMPADLDVQIVLDNYGTHTKWQ